MFSPVCLIGPRSELSARRASFVLHSDHDPLACLLYLSTLSRLWNRLRRARRVKMACPQTWRKTCELSAASSYIRQASY